MQNRTADISVKAVEHHHEAELDEIHGYLVDKVDIEVNGFFEPHLHEICNDLVVGHADVVAGDGFVILDIAAEAFVFFRFVDLRHVIIEAGVILVEIEIVFQRWVGVPADLLQKLGDHFEAIHGTVGHFRKGFAYLRQAAVMLH